MGSAGSEKMVRRSSWLYMYHVFFMHRAHWYSAHLRTLTDVRKMIQNAQDVAKKWSKKHVQALLNAFDLVVAPHKHQPETVMSCTQGPWRQFPSHQRKALPASSWITCPQNFSIEWLWITVANPYFLGERNSHPPKNEKNTILKWYLSLDQFHSIPGMFSQSMEEIAAVEVDFFSTLSCTNALSTRQTPQSWRVNGWLYGQYWMDDLYIQDDPRLSMTNDCHDFREWTNLSRAPQEWPSTQARNVRALRESDYEEEKAWLIRAEVSWASHGFQKRAQHGSTMMKPW